MNYENDIKIDENSLDIEWLNQTELAYSYGKNWAEYVFKLERKKEEIAVFKAELIDTINQDPIEFLGEGVKPTIGNIDSCILQNEEYKNYILELHELEYEVNIALIAKNEISNTRKAALQNLVILHGQNYFAGPTIPRDITLEASKKRDEKEINIKVSKKLKRTK